SSAASRSRPTPRWSTSALASSTEGDSMPKFASAARSDVAARRPVWPRPRRWCTLGVADMRRIRTGPVTPWHLALLPLVLAANYLFFVARHEGRHAVVAWAFGAEIVEVHWWPPRGADLSWVTFGFPVTPSPLAVPLQAVAPYAVAVGLLVFSWAAVTRWLG